MKADTPQIAVFTPQFLAMCVGDKPGQYKSADDVWRYAAQTCGITGISMHIGMLDVPKLIEDTEAREAFVAHYRNLGLEIIGLESHTDGQLSSISECYLSRFLPFAPKRDQLAERATIENRARKRVQEALRLGKLFGISRHQTFPGGRGIAHHDQWSTLPKGFREAAILQLAIQWEPTLEMAYECGQRIGMEIGHVMEGLTSVEDLLLMRGFLKSDSAKKALKEGIDFSHRDKEGNSTAQQYALAVAHDLDTPGHAKSGVFLEKKHAPFFRRQCALPFSEQSGKFATFGTVSPESAKLFGDALWREYNRNAGGSWGVIEGECMFIPNPLQAMRVAAENLRRVINGEDPISLQEITPEEWAGPTFETFAENPSVNTGDLLEMSREEIRTFNRRARELGLPIIRS